MSEESQPLITGIQVPGARYESEGSTANQTRRRIGKRCKNPNHRHTPLSSHHGPQDPRSYLSTKYESLDYDDVENDLCLESESKKSYRRFGSKNINRWLVCFIIGVLTACVAAVVDISIEQLSIIKLDYIRKYMRSCINQEKCFVLLPWLVWAGLNTVMVIAAAVLVVFIEPVAAGSGIPEIKCYLNGVKIPHVVRIKTLLCKVGGIIAAVAGGLACGKEGPMVHAGAVIAAGVSQGRSTSLGCDCKLFKDFRCDHVKRDFIACGAAAGVSAAFGAPIGGVLFALEEGASFWNQSLTWRIFFSSLVSSFTLNVILSAYKGTPGDLSNPGLANFGMFEIACYDWYEIFLFAIMGAVGGVLGAIFNEINVKLTLFRFRHLKNRFLKVLEVVLVALVTTAVGFCAMYFIQDCTYSQVDDNSTDTYNLQMQCNSGQYNSLATLFLSSPEETTKSLFHSPNYQYKWITLAVFFVIYFFMSVWTYGLNVPSGLFMPSLLTGAAFGRLIGVVLHHMFPGDFSNPGIYALVGAAAFLGGVTRMTISLTVIIMEATRNITFGLPIMITLVCARFVGNYFNEGLYEEHINLKQVPMLPWNPPVKSMTLTASNIMSTPVVVFNLFVDVASVVNILKTTTHNGFPVVELFGEEEIAGNHGQFKGLITREQLIILLIKQVYKDDNHASNHIVGAININDFRDLYPRHPSIESVNVPQEHLHMKIDLRPFINLSPYTCCETVSFQRLFNLFRSMGLRHIVIVNENNKVVGIVTRKDLAQFRVWRKQGTAGVEELTIGDGSFPGSCD